MMGLIGQGCEHGDVLEVTGTNTPTQTHPIDNRWCATGSCAIGHMVWETYACVDNTEE